MQRLSLARVLSRHWMLVVAVVAVAVAGFAVYRLHGIFGSRDVTTTEGPTDRATRCGNYCSGRTATLPPPQKPRLRKRFNPSRAPSLR
jgi:hypothetical protein